MSVPYTIECRADTGVNNVTMGVWLFLASEVMLFGALFSAYALLRTAAPAWPHGPDVLNVTIGGVNTIVLVAGTACIWRARGRSGISMWLGMSTAMALAFVVIKSFEWHGEMARGLVPATNTFLALYFTLTGLHVLHVIGGALANAWILATATRHGDAMTRNRLHAVSLYWTFVDIVWLVIFVLMYLS